MEKTLEARALAAYTKKAARDALLLRALPRTAYRLQIDGKAYVGVYIPAGIVGLYRISAGGRLRWVPFLRWPTLDQADIAKQIVYAMHVAPFAAKDPALATLKQAEIDAISPLKGEI